MSGHENPSVNRQNPDSEASQPSEIVLTSQPEKEAVFTASLSYLIVHTRHEVRGHLTEELIATNNALRDVIRRVASDLGKDKQYRPEEWLSIGISDFIQEEKLEEWANPSQPPHWTEEDFHLTAKYLLDKKREQKNHQK